MFEWMHDPDIQAGFQTDMTAKTFDDVVAFIKNTDYSISDRNDIHFAVAGEEDEYLGTISLKDISLRDKRAEYAISLRKCAHGKGIGYTATHLLLDYAFFSLGLNRVFLNVLSDNLAAIHLYQKCGFHYEGEFAEHMFLRGKYYNLQWYGIGRTEYLERNTKNENYAK